ncbi:unnamed protein product [Callosobruchus maculatus]|uniref:Uncharacterized protein n=1 Tax=Callosobruchus maculatus TaxID=64391 RepID=A0A653DH93_CALMS|nr:unnamed protein product [Callosobruchus maculatus]
MGMTPQLPVLNPKNTRRLVLQVGIKFFSGLFRLVR